MFLSYYRLRENPFGVTPDPRFLYKSETHREALASLIYGIESGVGFQALISHPGMGKTTLLFNLLEEYRATAHTAFLFQTQCNSREFLQYLLSELGADSQERDLVGMHEKFNQILIGAFRLAKRVIVVIDEAQNLDTSVLETVRLLSDFETSRVKLMQIIIAGQPQLAEKLANPELLQLRQRLSILSRLAILGRDDVESYVEHRLEVSGYRGPELFTPETLTLIAARSNGIPRNINTLCFNALSLGCALGRKSIGPDIIGEVLADLDPDFTVAERSSNSQVSVAGITLNAAALSQGSLATERDLGLQLVVEEARNATRATGTAIGLTNGSEIICRASIGATAPDLGTKLDTNSGISGECIRSGRIVQCDDAYTDPRVDSDLCRQLGIRSIVAMPLYQERELIGLLEISSMKPHAFEEGDISNLRHAVDSIVKPRTAPSDVKPRYCSARGRMSPGTSRP